MLTGWRGIIDGKMTDDTFSEWLLGVIEERDLSYSELGRQAGVSHARISQVISGDTPGLDFCKGIARAPNLPPETVLYRYYRCSTHLRLHRECHANNTPLDALVATFEAWLDNLRSVGLDAVVRDTMPEEVDRLEREREELRMAVGDMEAQLDRLAAAVASGTIRAQTAARREEKLYAQLNSTDELLQRNAQAIAALPKPEEQRAYLEQILAGGVGDLDDERKHSLNRALRNLGVRILCEEGEVKAIAF